MEGFVEKSFIEVEDDLHGCSYRLKRVQFFLLHFNPIAYLLTSDHLKQSQLRQRWNGRDRKLGSFNLRYRSMHYSNSPDRPPKPIDSRYKSAPLYWCWELAMQEVTIDRTTRNRGAIALFCREWGFGFTDLLCCLTVVFSGRKPPLQLNEESWYVPLQYGLWGDEH